MRRGRVVECHADAHWFVVAGRRGCTAARRGLDRMRSLHQAFDEVEIAVSGHRITELGDRFINVRVLKQRQQSRAQLGDAHRLDMGEGAEHGHPGQRPDGILDNTAAVVIGNVVEDHADHAAGTVQLLDAQRGGRGSLAHRPCVDHQHDRSGDDARDLQRAAWEFRRARCRRFRGHTMPVKDAHRTFDDHPIRTDRSVRKRAAHSFGTEQPGIEIATRATARMGQVGRVDEIGADLEGLDGATASAECGGEAEADRGLPRTRTQAANHEPRNPDLLEHEVPPDARCGPARMGTVLCLLSRRRARRRSPSRGHDASTG